MQIDDGVLKASRIGHDAGISYLVRGHIELFCSVSSNDSFVRTNLDNIDLCSDYMLPERNCSDRGHFQ